MFTVFKSGQNNYCLNQNFYLEIMEYNIGIVTFNEVLLKNT